MSNEQARAEPRIATLANGVRVLALALPASARTCAVGLYLRSGSVHESAADNGISHFAEHMAFKGTGRLDARALNRRAEVLGAEVNAHTDKDHTAFHMRGRAEDALSFVGQLAELLCDSRFPADELEREREVLLQEFAEDDDDPVSTTFKLLDRASFGTHPAAQPVIGTRALIERLRRHELVAWWQAQASGANLVVAVAAPAADPDALARVAEAAFASLQSGTPSAAPAPAWIGGVRSRAQEGSSQSHLAIGLPLPGRASHDVQPELAAALLGEGMSSPLMEQLRERQALAYYAAASADQLDGWGQFVVEASMAPKRLDEAVQTIVGLLRQLATRVDADEVERARNQVLVRRLRAFERPYRALEAAALDLLASGRVQSQQEWIAQVQSTDAAALRRSFERLLGQAPALAVGGAVPRGTRARVSAQLEGLTRGR